MNYLESLLALQVLDEVLVAIIILLIIVNLFSFTNIRTYFYATYQRLTSSIFFKNRRTSRSERIASPSPSPSTSKEKAASATPSKKSPSHWREILAAVDESERCTSQKNLARAVKLLDYITSCFNGDQMPPANEACKIILAELELYHLPIKGRPLLTIAREDINTKLSDYVHVSMKGFKGEDLVPEHRSKLTGRAIEELQRALQDLTFIMIVDALPMENSNFRADVYKAALKSAEILDLTINRAWQIDGPTVKAFLKEHDSQLTYKDFKEMTRVYTAVLSCKALKKEPTEENARKAKAASVLFFLHLKVEPHSWYGSSRMFEILYLLKPFSSFEDLENFESKAFFALERQLEVAEGAEPADPLHVAWASYDSAFFLSGWSEGFEYNRIEHLLKQGNESMAKCKPWLPPYFRKTLVEGVGIIETVLRGARKHYPRDYRHLRLTPYDMMSHEDVQEEMQREMLATEFSDPTPEHECAECGQASNDMSFCGRVS